MVEDYQLRSQWVWVFIQSLIYLCSSGEGSVRKSVSSVKGIITLAKSAERGIFVRVGKWKHPSFHFHFFVLGLVQSGILAKSHPTLRRKSVNRHQLLSWKPVWRWGKSLKFSHFPLSTKAFHSHCIASCLLIFVNIWPLQVQMHNELLT